MKVIYAVASGEYSDYRVLCVCDSKETAEQWAAALHDEEDGWNRDARVESITLIKEPPFKVHTVHLWQNWFDDGTHDKINLQEKDEYPLTSSWEYPSRPTRRFVRAPVHKDLGGRIEIRGRSREAVMKIYSEQKAIWLSQPRAYQQYEITDSL